MQNESPTDEGSFISTYPTFQKFKIEPQEKIINDLILDVLKYFQSQSGGGGVITVKAKHFGKTKSLLIIPSNTNRYQKFQSEMKKNNWFENLL